MGGACVASDGRQGLEDPETGLHPLARALDALGPSGAFRWLVWHPREIVVLLHRCGLHVNVARSILEYGLDAPPVAAALAQALAQAVDEGRTGEHLVIVDTSTEPLQVILQPVGAP